MRIWHMLLVSGVLCVPATSAWAGSWCSDKEPCKDPNQTCNGYSCVPTAKICTADSSCAAWQKCDFTCPGGIGGGGSGGGTVSVDAGATDPGSSGSGGSSTGSADAGTAVSTDAAVSTWDGGGKSDPNAPDAGANENVPDAMIPVDPCPKDKGVCVAVLEKVPEQAGCKALCESLVKCGLAFGSGSTSSGGSGSGSSGGGSSGGGGIPPSADAGSSEPYFPDATPTPAPDEPDGGFGPYDTNMPTIDAEVTPNPDALPQCIAICGVWVLEKVADPELAALEQCVSTQDPNGCDAIKTGCEATAQSFMKAAEANDSWSLGLGQSFSANDGTATAGGGGGGKGGSDMDASLGLGSDAGSSAPQQESAGTGDTGGGSGSSGCTAGSSAGGTGLAGLLIAAFAVVRRRRFV